MVNFLHRFPLCPAVSIIRTVCLPQDLEAEYFLILLSFTHVLVDLSPQNKIQRQSQFFMLETQHPRTFDVLNAFQRRH